MMTRPRMMTSTAKRPLPLATVMRLFLSGSRNQWSWLLVGIGLIGLWIVINAVDLSFVRYWGKLAQVNGVITDSREMNVSLNDQAVIATSYRFVSRDGIEIEDFSYATGEWHQDGATVLIEYPAGKPRLSRIRGMRRQILGPFGILFAIPAIAAIFFLLYSIRKGLRIKYLLEHGSLTTGTLVDKASTNMSVNEQTVYKLTFAFVADDGNPYHVSHKTHTTLMLEDEEAERLLYDPAAPANAVLVDTLPGLPKLDDDGVSLPQSIPVASCVIPALTLLGHGAYAMSGLF